MIEDLTLGAETRAVVDRVEHVHLGTADLERSKAFYRSVFGFALRFEEDGPYGRCAHVGTDRFYIALTETPGVGAAVTAPGHAAFYHLGFTTADLAAFRARLDRLGVAIDDEAARREGNAVYLSDPDGHEIEVVEYARGYAYA
jgi:catechol 2,3-dioxygenase-like lactoylglutathione lyase family enzyme